MAFYVQTLSRMVRDPGGFFRDQGGGRIDGSLLFLAVSSLLFACGGLLTGPPGGNRWVSGGILFANGVGMAMIGAGIGYAVIVLTTGSRPTFRQVLDIFALASGVTLLASWMTVLFWLTEPWKWWLVGTGLVHHCGLSRKQAVMTVGLSVGSILLGFWIIMGMIGGRSG
jgi:hypothetical protein